MKKGEEGDPSSQAIHLLQPVSPASWLPSTLACLSATPETFGQWGLHFSPLPSSQRTQITLPTGFGKEYRPLQCYCWFQSAYMIIVIKVPGPQRGMPGSTHLSRSKCYRVHGGCGKSSPWKKTVSHQVSPTSGTLNYRKPPVYSLNCLGLFIDAASHNSQLNRDSAFGFWDPPFSVTWCWRYTERKTLVLKIHWLESYPTFAIYNRDPGS